MSLDAPLSRRLRPAVRSATSEPFLHSDAMNAALPAVLDYPFAAPPAPGRRRSRSRRGVLWLRMPLPFALDHINLWLLDGRRRLATLVDCGYRRRARRARCGSATSRPRSARRPLRRIVATHCHPDHVGNAAWLAARFGAPVAMTHAEFLTAHAIAGAARRPLRRGDDRRSSAGTAWPPSDARRAARSAATATGAACPSCPQSFDRLLDGDARRAAATRPGASSRATAIRPSTRRSTRAERGVLISGDMLLPRISTNVSVWAVEPDGDPLRALPRLARRLRGAAARHAGAAVARPAVPRHRRCASRSCARTTRRGSPSSTTPCARPPRRSARPTLVPVLFRRELDLQQRFFAMGEAIAHLNYLWHAARARPPRRRRRRDPLRSAIDDPPLHARESQRPCQPRQDPRRAGSRARTVLRSRRARRIAALRRREEREGDRRLRRAPGRVRARRSSPTSSASARRSWSSPRRCWRTRTGSPRRR